MSSSAPPRSPVRTLASLLTSASGSSSDEAENDDLGLASAMMGLRFPGVPATASASARGSSNGCAVEAVPIARPPLLAFPVTPERDALELSVSVSPSPDRSAVPAGSWGSYDDRESLLCTGQPAAPPPRGGGGDATTTAPVALTLRRTGSSAEAMALLARDRSANGVHLSGRRSSFDRRVAEIDDDVFAMEM
jgi:hypothetical protein